MHTFRKITADIKNIGTMEQREVRQCKVADQRAKHGPNKAY